MPDLGSQTLKEVLDKNKCASILVGIKIIQFVLVVK